MNTEPTEPFCLPVMDDEDAFQQKLLDYKIEAKDFFKRGIRLVVCGKGDLRLRLYAYCFAHEWYDIIGCETAVEIAVKLGKTKAAVTKAIKLVQDSMGIEPGRGQRSEKGREQMAKARKSQLKGTK